jgi:hypothetical protein
LKHNFVNRNARGAMHTAILGIVILQIQFGELIRQDDDKSHSRINV